MANACKKLWLENCEKAGVPVAITEKWFEIVLNKYNTEVQRSFHNSNILELKSAFILNASNQIQSSVDLNFAIFFQYFHFDVKCDCFEKNCDEFKRFYDEAHLNDVS